MRVGYVLSKWKLWQMDAACVCWQKFEVIACLQRWPTIARIQHHNQPYNEDVAPVRWESVNICIEIDVQRIFHCEFTMLMAFSSLLQRESDCLCWFFRSFFNSLFSCVFHRYFACFARLRYFRSFSGELKTYITTKGHNVNYAPMHMKPNVAAQTHVILIWMKFFSAIDAVFAAVCELKARLGSMEVTSERDDSR